MSVIDRAAREFARLPGIGPKTALRLVYNLLKAPAGQARELAASVVELAERVRPCSECGNFSEDERCDVCSSDRRDRSLLCVVEEAYEVGAVERTGQYRGLYHVLGGRLSPLDGVGPESLNIDGLIRRVRDVQGGLEVILATNSSVEGEATAVYLDSVLTPLGCRVTRLARGIPMGSDLEYVDGSTIAQALAGRREM